MRLPRVFETLFPCLAVAVALCVVSSMASAQSESKADKGNKKRSCASDDSGLKLPAGFCATVLAEGIGHTRHLVVSTTSTKCMETDFWWPCKTKPARARPT